MRKIFRSFLVLLLFSSLFAMICSCTKEAPIPREGSIAPDFSLKDLSGETVQLSDLRGTVVLLNFWATWCPPCREEVPSLSRLNAALTGKGVRMVTVSIDNGGSNTVESFFRMTGYRLPTVLDPGGTVGKMYGITGVPETFILDRQGVIKKKVIGPFPWDDPSVITYLSELQNR
ncbi:MAG: TlpA disulfide reductase family protein [Geobacteraceae bacterium]|nr:TlpA disulfide reductase family protein [Geobacteraceae bacterium]